MLKVHHIGNRGYDRVPGVPPEYTSRVFARGCRRFLDWADWMVPEAWIAERNVLHHSFTSEPRDPDLVERNMADFHRAGLPRAAAYASLGLYAVSWKFLYYMPSTLGTWMCIDARSAGVPTSLRSSRRRGRRSSGVVTCRTPRGPLALCLPCSSRSAPGPG